MSELPAAINTNKTMGGTAKFRQECIFWFTAALLLFLYIWNPVLSQDEVIQAEIAREIEVSGNWFHPALNWQLLSDRSPLIYWCIIPIAKLSGNFFFAVRLPSLLAAAGALYALGALGRKLFDARIASAGCWMFLGCAGLLLWGRTGSADMIGTAAVLTAAAWAIHKEEKTGFFSYLIFYLICFAGALFKDLTMLFITAVLLFPMLLPEKKWSRHLNWKHLLAFLSGALLYFGLMQLTVLFDSLTETPGSAAAAPWSSIQNGFLSWYGELALLKERWYIPWRDLALFLLPWTPLLPVGVGGMLKKWKSLTSSVRSLFIGLCAALILCTFICSDSPRNIMVLVPFVLLFNAAGFCGCGVEKWNQGALNCAYYAAIVTASLGIGSIICYPLWDRLADCTPPAALVLAPVAAGILAWGALFMDHRRSSSLSIAMGLPHKLSSVVLAWTLLAGCVMSVFLPVTREILGSEMRFFRYLRHVREKYDCRSASFMGKVPAACLFYGKVRSAVPEADDIRQLKPKYDKEKILLFFKDRKEVRNAFLEQCRKYSIVPDKPIVSEERSRWSALLSKEGKFVSYLITLPDKKEPQK